MIIQTTWKFQGHEIKIVKVIFILVCHSILKFGGFYHKTSNYSQNTKYSGKSCLSQIVARDIYYSSAKEKFQFWENLDSHKSSKKGQKVKISKVCLVTCHRKAF